MTVQAYEPKDLNPSQRSLPLVLTIDPGFVHRRRIETILGAAGMKYVDELTRQLPELPEWQRRVRVDHIYTRVMLDWCIVLKLRPLGALLATRDGGIFCSTEKLGPCPNFYETERATSPLLPEGDYGVRAELQYSTKRVVADTLKSCLAVILGDAAHCDCGGETSDFYSAHLRIKGNRTDAAFLLKGPARFEPMGLNDLGKNNDQICRLSP